MRLKGQKIEHDLTHTYWGHNYSVIDWHEGSLWVWLTPGPREGDIIILQGKKGVIRAEVVKSEWQSNVDDMYKVRVVPERSDADRG